MRIAVLGAGRLGSFRARILSGLPGVDKVILGNRTVERAEKVAEEIGGTTGTIDEAVDSEPDAVFASLATELHAEALHRCTDAGLPIFCEKPIALTLPETEGEIEHAEDAGKLILVAFQRRLDPDYRKAYEAVRDSTLGTLYSVRITAHDAEPAPEEFIASSGGTYRDLHIHDFDLARWSTGLNVEHVYAVGSVRGFNRYAKFDDVDNVAILMTMSDGLPVIITGARHNPRGHDFRLEVFGSKDSLSVGQAVLTQPRPVEADAPTPTKGPYSDFMETFGECLQQETMAFIEVMKGERENPSPPDSAMEALRVAVACEVSRKEKREVWDLQVIQLRLEGGRLANIEVYVNAGYGYEVDLEVLGDAGTIHIAPANAPELRRQRCAGRTVEGDWLERFPAAYKLEMRRWIEDLRNGKPTDPDAWDGYISLLAVESCIASLQSGLKELFEGPKRPKLYQ